MYHHTFCQGVLLYTEYSIPFNKIRYLTVKKVILIMVQSHQMGANKQIITNIENDELKLYFIDDLKYECALNFCIFWLFVGLSALNMFIYLGYFPTQFHSISAINKLSALDIFALSDKMWCDLIKELMRERCQISRNKIKRTVFSWYFSYSTKLESFVE